MQFQRVPTRLFLTLLTATLMAACPEDEPTPAVSADATTDTASDGGGDTQADGDAGPLCPAPPEPLAIDTSQTKFALSMFHYNIQYVIGGLEVQDDNGEWVYLANQEALAKGWDNDRVEDWIVTATFHPVLEIYDANPNWRVTLEMQAYMIEVLADRHPETLALLQKMAQSGQAELVSFHYADQLFMAYPREDLQRSIDRTKQVFEEYCLPLSGVVFNQEGQAGEGRQQMLLDNGYTIGVFPRNLWRYAQGNDIRWPYYSSRGGTLIVGPGGVDPASGVEVNWTFFDDGELRTAAENINPYLAPVAPDPDPARIQDYIEKLQETEANGFKITTITDFVAHLEAMGVEKKPAPPLLDGTWQPPSTDSIHRWLGGRNEVFVGSNRDREVRSGNSVARVDVAAVQRIYDHAAAGGIDVSDLTADLGVLWDNLWHAQVSDSSGVNPWLGEVLFGIRQNAKVMEDAKALRDVLMSRLGYDFVEVDLMTDTVESIAAKTPQPSLAPADDPIGLEVLTDGRTLTESWAEVATDHYRVTITASEATPDDACDSFVPSDGTPCTEATELVDCDSGFVCAPNNECKRRCDYRQIIARWPRTIDAIRYTPALIEEEVVDYDFSEFSFLEAEAYLPLSNGLIGIGEGVWVIKHVATTHLAARIGPAHATVDFIDRALQQDDAATWHFDVVFGDAMTALSIANRLNIHPSVQY